MENRIDFKSSKEALFKIFDYFELKLLLSPLFIFTSWAVNGEKEIAVSILILIAIDTVTGMWSVIKLEGWTKISSWGFYKAPAKFFVFLIMMKVSRIVDSSIPTGDIFGLLPMPKHLMAPTMDFFLVSTEAISVLENFAKLGFPVPLFILNKLKTMFNKKS